VWFHRVGKGPQLVADWQSECRPKGVSEGKKEIHRFVGLFNRGRAFFFFFFFLQKVFFFLVGGGEIRRGWAFFFFFFFSKKEFVFSLDVEQEGGGVREFVLCAISESSKGVWIDSITRALAPFRAMAESMPAGNSSVAPVANMEKHIHKGSFLLFFLLKHALGLKMLVLQA
jgi:hypothetical protein